MDEENLIQVFENGTEEDLCRSLKEFNTKVSTLFLFKDKKVNLYFLKFFYFLKCLLLLLFSSFYSVTFALNGNHKLNITL